MKRSDYATQILVVGWVHVGLGLVLLVIGTFIAVLLGGLGLVSQDTEAVRVLGCFGLVGLALFTAFSLPAMVAGYGLLKKRSWGRVAAIIVAVFNLFNIPIGTAVGVYTLWLLTHEEATDYFGGATGAGQATSGRA